MTFGSFCSSLVLTVTFAATVAHAQDIPGVEICTAEKNMDRRTSCLQSNVNFLQQSLTKQTLATQQRLDALGREVLALKGEAASLRKEIDQLKTAADQKDQKEPAKK